MAPDGTNPAFQRAIPHGMVIIDLLSKVVLFGVSPGSPRAVSREHFRSPSGGISRGVRGSIWAFKKGVRTHIFDLTHPRTRTRTRAPTRIQARTRIPTQSRPRARTPSLAELPLHFFSGNLKEQTFQISVKSVSLKYLKEQTFVISVKLLPP